MLGDHSWYLAGTSWSIDVTETQQQHAVKPTELTAVAGPQCWSIPGTPLLQDDKPRSLLLTPHTSHFVPRTQPSID